MSDHLTDLDALESRIPSVAEKQEVERARKEIASQSKAMKDMAKMARDAARMVKSEREDMIRDIADHTKIVMAQIAKDGVDLSGLLILEAKNILVNAPRDPFTGGPVIEKEQMDLIKIAKKAEKELQDRLHGRPTQHIEANHTLHISDLIGSKEFAELDAALADEYDIVDVEVVEE